MGSAGLKGLIQTHANDLIGIEDVAFEAQVLHVGFDGGAFGLRHAFWRCGLHGEFAVAGEGKVG